MKIKDKKERIEYKKKILAESGYYILYLVNNQGDIIDCRPNSVDYIDDYGNCQYISDSTFNVSKQTFNDQNKGVWINTLWNTAPSKSRVSFANSLKFPIKNIKNPSDNCFPKYKYFKKWKDLVDNWDDSICKSVLSMPSPLDIDSITFHNSSIDPEELEKLQNEFHIKKTTDNCKSGKPRVMGIRSNEIIKKIKTLLPNDNFYIHLSKYSKNPLTKKNERIYSISKHFMYLSHSVLVITSENNQEFESIKFITVIDPTKNSQFELNKELYSPTAGQIANILLKANEN